MDNSKLDASKREKNLKLNSIRKDGEVPGIIYGASLDKPISIKAPEIELARFLSQNSKSSLVTVKLPDKKITCLVKEVQKDNLTDTLIHVDFQAVSAKDRIKMNIPINFEGRESIEYNNLILEPIITEIEIEASADNLPSELTVDVSSLGFEDKIFAKDITLPERVSLLTEEDALVAVVTAPAISAADEDAEGGEGGDLAPGQEAESETQNYNNDSEHTSEPAEGK
ncbi:50S ribosomal protein L25 [Alloiococcus sp. CFN-8]|uniref:50S ribosomal protein L25 n=1 Tax=Alloiococcus sp. CFN-8 TaxID=3416081 RepID=UPI003CFAE007